ncbi:hypothetical protein ILYODFUR_019317 [Ilyodon furcidens]|uniref:Uncharacterized protein n=1 Tax=Ilyodon furcidens TaxID=33524 RepID=A0ABV0UHV9_9TELE
MNFPLPPVSPFLVFSATSSECHGAALGSLTFSQSKEGDFNRAGPRLYKTTLNLGAFQLPSLTTAYYVFYIPCLNIYT